MTHRTVLFSNPSQADAIDDPASLVYADGGGERDDLIYAHLDTGNRCINAGGCVFLTQCGHTACVHCGTEVA